MAVHASAVGFVCLLFSLPKIRSFGIGTNKIFRSSVAHNSNAILISSRSQHITLKSGSTEDASSLLEEIRSMRVKTIKDELTQMGLSTKDVFEKEELVQRLLEARTNPTSTSTMACQRPSVKESEKTGSDSNVLEAPLYLVSIETGTRIAAVNGANIAVDAKDHPYPAVKIGVMNGNEDEFKLNLLLDTACSGFVLRPSVVEKYKLPSLPTPVTMTGAGGVAGNTGLTQLEKFRLEDQAFGPLPAAVQDIGALPAKLDGIIGLSFLNQFEGVDLDFRKGIVAFHPKGQKIPELGTELEVVAEGKMSLIPTLSIYVVEVLFGGKGPVRMLVDSGASDSFLNWRGVADLGLSRESPALRTLPSPMGAVGSDAVAMELTHRIGVSSLMNLGSGDKSGLPLKGARRLTIDIGNIAILDTLKNDNIGGILGIDAFMRCDAVRMIFHGDLRMQMMLDQGTAEKGDVSQ